MVRMAQKDDFDEILTVYQTAREYMARSGNPTQWGGTYPSRALLEADIQLGRLYVVTAVDRICGVFMFMTDAEPTYAQIDGAWLNDAPYGTIHRIASNGTHKGVFAQCLQFCRQRIGNLRIDTHADNHTMQHLIEKNGFVKCGVIHVFDGSPRIAYQLTGES